MCSWAKTTKMTNKMNKPLKLQRTLGRGAAIVLCFNGIVGSGIFVSPSGNSEKLVLLWFYFRNTESMPNGRNVDDYVGFSRSAGFTWRSVLRRARSHYPQNRRRVCHFRLCIWATICIHVCLGKLIWFLIWRETTVNYIMDSSHFFCNF